MVNLVKKGKQFEIMKYAILFFILYFIHFVVDLVGDDLWFSDVSSRYSLLDYIITRYQGWTGRIFPEFLLYTILDQFVWLWRILNPLMIMLLAYGLVRIVKSKVEFKDVLIAFITLGFFSVSILSNGFFWITGTFNYSWPIALGLISMIPYADMVLRNENPNNKWFSIYFLCGVLASISQEQVALCISSFAVLTIISMIYQKKKFDKKIVILTGIMIIGTCILIFAPGNGIRWEIEVDNWYPRFDEMSVKGKIFLGIIWLFEKLFVEMKGLIILLSVIAILSSLKQEAIIRTWYYRFFVILLIGIIGMNALDIGKGNLYNFQLIANIVINQTGTFIDIVNAIFPYVLWTVWATLLFVININNTENKLFILFSYLAAICTLVIIFFSPTIYASGNRVLTVSAVIFALITLHFIFMKKIIPMDRNYGLFLYAVIPLVNFARLVLIWIVRGFMLI